MALGKNRSSINVKGGGTFIIRELSPSPTDAFSNLGHILSVELTTDPGMIDQPGADGNMLDSLSGKLDMKFKITLMQSSYDELNWLLTADGKYFDGLYSVYLVGLAKWQQWSLPIMKVKPGVNLTFAGSTARNPVVEGTLLAPSAAFTRTPTAFNITANKPYVLYENATAAADPTDVAATMWTAIK